MARLVPPGSTVQGPWGFSYSGVGLSFLEEDILDLKGRKEDSNVSLE